MELIYNLPHFQKKKGRRSIEDYLLSKLKCYQYGGYEAYNNCDNLVACKFANALNNRHILACSGEKGNILMKNTSGEIGKSSVTNICDNALFTISWSDHEMKLITAGGDHILYLLNISPSGAAECLSRFSGLTRAVTSTSFKPHCSDVFAAGCRNGSIALWDARNHNNSKPDIHIKKAHVTQRKISCISSLTFTDEYHLLSTAYNDQNIKIWDIRKSYSSRKYIRPAYTLDSIAKRKNDGYTGFSNTVLNSDKSKLYAASTRDDIFCIDMINMKLKPVVYGASFRCNQIYTNCVLSQDDKYLAQSGSDSKIIIWKVDYSTYPIATLNMIDESLAGIDWSRDNGFKIAICSDSGEPFIWMPSGDLSFTGYNIIDMYFSPLDPVNNRSPKENTQSAVKYTTFKPTENDEENLRKVLLTLPSYRLEDHYQHHTCKRQSSVKQKGNWLTDLSAKSKKPKLLPLSDRDSDSSE